MSEVWMFCKSLEAELEQDLMRHTLRMADYIIRKAQERQNERPCKDR